MRRAQILLIVLLFAAGFAACRRAGSPGPMMPAPAPPTNPAPAGQTASDPPRTTRDVPPAPPIIAPDETVTGGDPLTRAAIEEINKNSPLKPVFFAYDSDALDDLARKTMAENADVLKKYASWVITIEGHCDERGTAEYNLALGDRRAIAVKNYLVTLGVSAERLRTVSYGNEFPFDPAHDEGAWSQNRRAHFMLTAK